MLGVIPLKRLKALDLAPLLLIALTLAFFYRLAFTDSILARGDTFSYFYPYWHVRNAALLSGLLPLWSPDLFMGVPLLANSQLGTFYPPNWIVAPLAPPDGIRVSILLHVAWAAIGTYLLARRTLGVERMAALTAAVVFAFGGHVGAHVEQINQLQGLAWLPWLIYLFDRALSRPRSGVILLGIGLALQFFTGHTQTVFITAVALAIYALCRRPLRGLITLALAGVIALILAVPQLIPTLELTGVSNRRGGLNVNQATAFSFSPFVTGRGLLPSFDSPIFGEYVAYPGVIGLGLAVIGALTSPPSPLSMGREGDKRRLLAVRLPLSPRATWLIIALVGLALAYGLYNPLYWLLATLPGFNLFRVPARWLALFALGTAMLAGLGVEALIKRSPLTPAPSPTQAGRGEGANMGSPLAPLSEFGEGQGVGSRLVNPRRITIAILLVSLGLAALSALTLRQNDGTPVSLPTSITLIAWATALIILLIGVGRRVPILLIGGVVIELWLAALILPYNWLIPPDAYTSQRFTESQLIAYQAGQTPPGRVLSISGLLFDPGDRATLDARYAGLAPEARALAFDAVKLKETLGANLPLIWGIPSADGYDGGVLPTADYTAFTSLLLPPGELRTIDGRLREILALPECGGACIPDQRWLNLMGVRYLITDKVYDLVNDGVFYDTTFTRTSEATYANPQAFVADAVDVLCAPCDDLRVGADGVDLQAGESVTVGDYTRQRFIVGEPSAPTAVSVETGGMVRAVTLVDTRTGDFQQLAPDPWTRVLSSDVKMYENADVLPRAFVVADAALVSDDDPGTEDALKLMRDPAFDPAQTVTLSGETDVFSPLPEVGEGLGVGSAPIQSVQMTAYTDTRVALTVTSDAPGYLVLTDAYYPGWVATVDGSETPIQRADVMFRAVSIPAGTSEVVFEYRPAWLPLAPLIGAAAWIVAVIALLVFGRRSSTS